MYVCVYICVCVYVYVCVCVCVCSWGDLRSACAKEFQAKWSFLGTKQVELVSVCTFIN